MGSLTTSIAVAITTIGLTPRESVTSDRVDLIELNHFYDEHGKHVFDQIIFYDWSPDDSRYHVRAWRLLKKPAQIPTRNWTQGDYIAVWHDGEVLRRVRAHLFQFSSRLASGGCVPGIVPLRQRLQQIGLARGVLKLVE